MKFSIGNSVTLNCADTSGSAAMVQWLNSAGTVINLATTSTPLTFSTLSDQQHESVFTCRALLSGVMEDLNYTILVLSKFILS